MASLDRFGDPAVLRRQAEAAATRLDPDLRPGARQEGTDASGSVRVTIDAQGTVTDVEISRRWTTKLPGERLGDAVLEAYRRAQEKRAAAAALLASHGPRGVGNGRSIDDGDLQRFRFEVPDTDDDRWLDWVWRTLNDTDARQQHRPGAGESTEPVERVVSGPHGHVRLRVAGVEITAVVVGDVRFAESQPDLVATDARAAFGSAQRDTRRRTTAE